MFKEVAYWIYRLFMSIRKKADRMDAILFTSYFLFMNVLSIIGVVERYLNFKILDRLPELDKRQLSSWVIVALQFFPFVWFVYCRYFTTSKLQCMLEEYARKPKIRLLFGRIFVCFYCILSWVLAILEAEYRNN